ncbi:MAG: amidohydrolase [Bacteroidetes bacterium]|nr:amidohydrolase [Bacteroidota bacterium]
MQDIKVAIIQTDLFWENVQSNLLKLDQDISKISEAIDIIVLPEMFNTGFSMNPSVCAGNTDCVTMQWIKKKALEKNCVIIGSLLIAEKGKFFNRLFWMQPDGNFKYYDKKHLFRFGKEHDVFSPGNKKLITSLKGWNFRPLVCYDLRFPVWSKNVFINENYEYDCLIYIANWPEKRKHAWISLLIARAIENQAYVIGVNRVGTDGKGNVHSGDSLVIDPKGNIILQLPSHKEVTEVITLSYSEMQTYRTQFPVALDWDKFQIF